MSQPDRCHHCGQLPDPDAGGDHSCPCPNRDGECPEHDLVGATKDDRCSDEATGLPPLEVVDPTLTETILLTSWAASQGLATTPTGATLVVRYLSVRGLARMGDGTDPRRVQWAQIHIAVPVEHAVDVAAALAKGTTEELGGSDG